MFNIGNDEVWFDPKHLENLVLLYHVMKPLH